MSWSPPHPSRRTVWRAWGWPCQAWWTSSEAWWSSRSTGAGKICPARPAGAAGCAADFPGRGRQCPGHRRGASNVVCVKVGRGLGAGLILGGALYRGPDNSAGEINHILVDPHGPQCYCGNYGCLGTLVSAPAIVGRAVKELKRGAESALLSMVDGDLERVSVAVIAQASHAGDAYACQLLEQTGRYLGIGIATLVNLLNPDLVIIGGGVILAGAPLLEPIRSIVKLRTPAAAGQRVQVVPARLGVEAPAIGAAALVMVQHGLLPTSSLPFA